MRFGIIPCSVNLTITGQSWYIITRAKKVKCHWVSLRRGLIAHRNRNKRTTLRKPTIREKQPPASAL